jgi:hypothetical protein
MLGNVIRLALVAGVVGLIGVALFRPAAIFGVDGKALGSSVGGVVAHSSAKCTGGSGVWRCEVTGGRANGAHYEVTTHGLGCWSGTRVAATAAVADDAEQSVSGCIALTDLFGH